MISPLTEALAERGFDVLTPVQEAVIAPDLTDRDLLVSAQTGSGKTVGFGLAIAPTLLGEADRFGPAAAPLALIVAPTRELALQVMRELTWLYARTGAVVTSCVGGMDMRTERRALDRGAHLVVGTPGRLRDHIERGALDLGDLRAVVLDEADEMLDMGFREDLEFMLSAAPAERRTLMFSATVPAMIAKMAQKFQRDARRITTLGSTEQHADIAYQAVRVAATDVDNAVFNLLRLHAEHAAIVFCNTRVAVTHLSARLTNRGLAVVTLSGELSQTERTHALQAMRDGRARVCVATDVAARGIDLPNLNLVIHADLPTNAESLLHRSGRTGRAGRKGISALIVPPRSVKRAEQLFRWAKLGAEWTVAPSVEDVLRRDEERLLADPGWQEAPTDEQAVFAAKLLDLYTPEAIAAAYLRLYQSRHAPPEEVLPPETRPAPRDRRGFDNSRWIALSVGRAARAEPRWLLPMLCRAGNLDRSSIGAIRVQDQHSHVEIAENAVAGFMAALGAGGVLEDGITAQLMDAAPGPEQNAAPEAPRRDATRHRAGPPPPRRPSAPDSGPRGDTVTDTVDRAQDPGRKARTAKGPRTGTAPDTQAVTPASTSTVESKRANVHTAKAEPERRKSVKPVAKYRAPYAAKPDEPPRTKPEGKAPAKRKPNPAHAGPDKKGPRTEGTLSTGKPAQGKPVQGKRKPHKPGAPRPGKR